MSFRIDQLAVYNLATVGGSITAGSFVKSGGTSSQFLKADGSVDSNAYITGITSGMVTTALGYTPVPNTRNITINGVTQDLSVDRTWTISAGVSSVTGSGSGISVSPTTGAVVISNTGVTSNVAGTGISVSGATGAVTITNTGVTSIVAGTAITISGATGAVTINNAGVTSVNGNTGAITGIITTSNYNSYSPTLTGGGASGTWGISISGNAATVTNGVYTTGSYANPSWITSLAWSKISSTPTTISGYGITDALYQAPATIDVNAFNTTGLYRGSTSGWTNRPPVVHNGGALLQIDTHPGNYFSQMFFDTGGNRIYIRAANAGTWSSWETLLNSGNYNSYSPTLTGGGASGTWSINITGNAGYASSAGNADTVDGYHASTSTIGNYIVVRDGNGYIFGNYINMTDDGNPGGGTAITSFITKQGDNYYRSVSPTNAMVSIRGVASGSWGINITGSAGSETLQTVTSRGASTTSTLTSTNVLGLYVNSGSYSYIGINSVSNWAYVSLQNNGSTSWDIASYAGGSLEFRPYGSNGNRIIMTLGGNLGVNNTNPSYRLHVGGDIYADGGWLRVSGTSGLYFETYGGGWHMNDSTWIRSYNGKNVYMSADVRTGGQFQLENGYSYWQRYGTWSSSLHRIAYMSFDWDGSYNTYSNHGISSTDVNGSFSDSMSINSFNDINLRLDSNGNNGDSYVRFHNDTTGNNVFSWIGYNGSNYAASFARDIYVQGGTGGNFGNRLIVGGASTPYTLQDTNIRPTIYARGAYPVLTLDHTATGNTQHGPTIQFVFDGLSNRQWVIGCNGQGTFMDFGFSSNGYSNTDYNPHNGISGYNGNTIMRIIDNAVGIGGDWGNWGAGNPAYTLDVRGTIYSNTDMRAPIFYDSDNTAYYANFADSGTSINIAGKITTAISGGTIISHGAMTDAFGYNGSYGTYIGSPVGGTYYIYANGTFYDNGPVRTLLHTGNYTSYTLPIGGSWYGINMPGSRWGGYAVSGGEIVFGNGLPNAGQMGMLIDGAYVAGENNGFWSLPSNNDWNGRRGMYWDGSYLNFTANSPTSVFTTLRLANGFELQQGGSNYGQFNSWVHLPGFHGLYSAQNSAHFYPNDGSYGSWKISGSRNGWGGIEFANGGNGAVSLMNNNDSNTSGFHNNTYGWQIRWYNGTLYCGKNSYGGGDATVLDSSNYNSYAPTLTGGNASGTWAINITGNAATATIANAAKKIQSDYQEWDFSWGSHTVTTPMSISIWDNYTQSGAPSSYGTLIDMYGLSGHQQDQFYFYQGTILHRYGWYGNNNWNGWYRVLTSNTDPYAANMNQYVRTSDNPTFGDIYSNGWFRNNNNNQGLYNQNTTQHWSSKDNGYWDASSTTTVSSIRLWTGGHVSALRGYVYANTSNEIGFLRNDGNWALRCDSSSNVFGHNNIYAYYDVVAYYSDERLKTKTGKVENALEKITSLEAFTYVHNELAQSFGYEDNKEQQIGLSAQDVQKIAPELVTLAAFDVATDEEGNKYSKSGENYLTIKYDRLVPILIEAIKEQQKQIDELKARLD